MMKKQTVWNTFKSALPETLGSFVIVVRTVSQNRDQTIPKTIMTTLLKEFIYLPDPSAPCWGRVTNRRTKTLLTSLLK
jgi:hypothetical protein